MEMTPEQRAEIEKKLAQMSPEELQALQQQQCIFCQIVQGKIPARSIYEDDKIKVVLDINPASPGHCLILPKTHYMVLPQVPKEIVEHMFKISKQVSYTLLRALKVDGTSWFVANGALAGQRAQHVMAHVIPRVENDNIGLMLPKNKLDEEQAKTLTDTLKPVMEAVVSGKIPMPSKQVTAKTKPPSPEEKKDEKKEEPAPPEQEKPQAEPDMTKEEPDVTQAEPEEPDRSIEDEETKTEKEKPELTPEEETSEEETKEEKEPSESKPKKTSLDDITKFLAGK